MAVSSYIVS